MKCIFDIPIYSLSPNDLQKRYISRAEVLTREYYQNHSKIDEDHLKEGIALSSYPYRLWQYNHIVGYIKISTDGRDMNFNVYLPAFQIERYLWKSNRKKFLRDIEANGIHFYLGHMKTNADIQQRLVEMLGGIIETHVPKHWYVDKSTFNATYRHIDYLSIIQEEKNNGQTENAQP